jgi:hypothetical protein
MSLSRSEFAELNKRREKLTERVCALSVQFDAPFNNLSDKILVNHYGVCYLFGKEIDERTTDEQIVQIVKQTPEEEYDGHVDFFGRWIVNQRTKTLKLTEQDEELLAKYVPNYKEHERINDLLDELDAVMLETLDGDDEWTDETRTIAKLLNSVYSHNVKES